MKLSIVATIYNKDVESLEIFLKGFVNQTYKDFELILVDDCSSVDYQKTLLGYVDSFQTQYIRLGRNQGQCHARNIGIREASSDFICVVDSDCVPNTEFVAAHVRELQKDVVDVVIGAYNIEANGREIWGLINKLQQDPVERAKETNLQYPSNPAYFLNFITRNVSFKRRVVPPQGLFNEEFAYVGTDPQSGFGWEDVEAGWRLFRQGHHFSYTCEAFTVHLSHSSTTCEVIKPLRSMRNFSKFLIENPEVIYSSALSWILDTYCKIDDWLKNAAHEQKFLTGAKPNCIINIALTAENEASHALVIESVLSQWEPGISIYLQVPVGSNFSVATYYAKLHSYVRAVHTLPRRRGPLTLTLSDDLIIAPKQLSEYRAKRAAHRTVAAPFLGGSQSPQNFFHKDLSTLLAGKTRASKKRLKILTYRWHVGHQYELWKLPHDFYVVEDETTMGWDYTTRPFPKNARFIKRGEVNPKEFDLAILHFDENVVNPARITNGVLPACWGAIFRTFMTSWKDLPKIAICHGTPPFHGMFNVDYKGKDLMEEWQPEITRIRRFVGNMPIVCNSHNAWAQWAFPNSRVIWQGFDASEYDIGRRRKKAMYCANSIRHRPWYRGYNEFKYLTDKFPIDYLGRDDLKEFRPVRVPPINQKRGQSVAEAQFKTYLETIGDYSIFVNTTLRSPMPRSRAEAMLVGACCVTMDYHDESMFITNGMNGFTGKTKEELEEHLQWCFKNPVQARQIGLRGRETIKRLFSNQRYLTEWQETLYDLVG